MRIIYQNADGGCSVIAPAPNSDLTIEEIAAKDVPTGVPFRIVPDEAVPADRTYRNAWVADVDGGRVGHDMPKAREIHKQHMRVARTPLLGTLDTAYLRADELGGPGAAATKGSIAAQKQVLRDVTARPDLIAAQTVAELKAVWPAVLGANPLL